MKTVMHQAFSNVEMIHNYLWERFQRYESLLGREGQWLNPLSANPQKWSNDQFDHFVGLTLKGLKLQRRIVRLLLFLSKTVLSVEHKVADEKNVFLGFRDDGTSASLSTPSSSQMKLFHCLDFSCVLLIFNLYLSLTFLTFLLHSWFFCKCCL